MNILIVDDHQLFRKSFIKLLETFEEVSAVEEAGDGKQAMALLKSKKIDIIFMDVRMPVMDGFECCKELLRIYPQAKVVILTQLDSKPLILHFVQMGVKSFMTKNVEAAEIQNGIQELMKGNCYFPEDILNIIKNSLSQLNGYLNFSFSEKERRILSFLERGLTSKELAQHMQLSTKTINSYREQLLERTKTKNVAELISWSYKNGILS